MSFRHYRRYRVLVNPVLTGDTAVSCQREDGCGGSGSGLNGFVVQRVEKTAPVMGNKSQGRRVRSGGRGRRRGHKDKDGGRNVSRGRVQAGCCVPGAWGRYGGSAAREVGGPGCGWSGAGGGGGLAHKAHEVEGVGQDIAQVGGFGAMVEAEPGGAFEVTARLVGVATLGIALAAAA